MFRKPKNLKIRQRQREETNNSDDEGETMKLEQENPDISFNGAGGKKVFDKDENEKEEESPLIFSKPKKPTLFSFDQDEGMDVEEFKIKKPSYKKRAEKLARKQRELEDERKRKEQEEEVLIIEGETDEQLTEKLTTIKQRKLEEQRRKEQEAFFIIDGESNDEDDTALADEEAQKRAQESDDEFAEWGNHQMKKAVSTQKVKQMIYEKYAVTYELPPEVVHFRNGEDDFSETRDLSIPSCSQIDLTEIMMKLKKRINDKQEFIDSQKAELQRNEATVSENHALIAEIESDYPGLQKETYMYQEVKAYLKNGLPPADSEPYQSLISSLKLISETNDSRFTTEINQFILETESSDTL